MYSIHLYKSTYVKFPEEKNSQKQEADPWFSSTRERWESKELLNGWKCLGTKNAATVSNSVRAKYTER